MSRAPRVPCPRAAATGEDAVIREAGRGDEHAEFWRGVYYSCIAALVAGRGDQALDALHAVVTAEEVTP